MTTERIIKHFKKNGYIVARCWSGSVSISRPCSRFRLFPSYAAAHRFYFGY